VIFALRHPAVLLGLLLGFLVGVGVRAAVQRSLTTGFAGRRRLRSVHTGRRSGFPRPAAGWASYLDPFGAVAAALSGVGWGTRVPSRRTGRGSDIALLLAALGVHAAFAAVGLAGYVAAGGAVADFGVFDLSSVLHGSFDFALVVPSHAIAAAVSAGFAAMNIGCGLLALVPIPPLELGVVLWSRLPRSAGARRLAYRVLEEQWGIAVVLLFLLLPLAGQQPLLLALINDASTAIFKHF
jgi:hypothetical protein